MVNLAIQVNRFRRRYLANHAVAEAVLLATITALIGYGNRFLRIDMTESMAILFRECEAGGDYDNLCQYVEFDPHLKSAHSISLRTSVQWRMVNSLLLATIIRIALVVVSAGCKVPAGIFVPSMAIGASFGRMVGIIVKAMYRYASIYSATNTVMSMQLERTQIQASSPIVSLMFHASPQEPTPSSVQLLL